MAFQARRLTFDGDNVLKLLILWLKVERACKALIRASYINHTNVIRVKNIFSRTPTSCLLDSHFWLLTPCSMPHALGLFSQLSPFCRFSRLSELSAMSHQLKIPKSFCLVPCTLRPAPLAINSMPYAFRPAPSAFDAMRSALGTMRVIGTPVACEWLGYNRLCIAISSLYFVEFPKHSYYLTSLDRVVFEHN